jgi:N-hydroxyarylamine O-acetyltransferase
MSGLDVAPPRATGARVLALGRSPEVLETVTQDLAELGFAVSGSTEAERAADQFDTLDFDLIAFGGGLIGPLSERQRKRLQPDA